MGFHGGHTTNQADFASLGHPTGLPKPKNNKKFLLDE
jgi:hypothetical protein